MDVLGTVASLRIAPNERRAAATFLAGHRITADALNASQHRAVVKKHLVEMARGWPLYFARLFHVSGTPQASINTKSFTFKNHIIDLVKL